MGLTMDHLKSPDTKAEVATCPPSQNRPERDTYQEALTSPEEYTPVSYPTEGRVGSFLQYNSAPRNTRALEAPPNALQNRQSIPNFRGRGNNRFSNPCTRSRETRTTVFPPRAQNAHQPQSSQRGRGENLVKRGNISKPVQTTIEKKGST